MAAEAGCTAIALTDHDRVDGIAAARRRGGEIGVEVIGGCELSCVTDSGTLHLLAYFIEDGDGPLEAALPPLQQARDARNRHLAERLAELGLPVTLEEIETEAGGGSVGRPHVAAVLVRKGIVGSIQEAFDEWLAKGRPGYVARSGLGVTEAIRLVRASGGAPVLAHPLTLKLEPLALDAALAELAAHGLDGLEAHYGRYTPEERSRLVDLARRHGLVATGGSDYHGTYKPDLRVGTGRGDLQVPADVLEQLDACRARA